MPLPRPPSPRRRTICRARLEETGHGRLERRTASVVAADPDLAAKLPGLAAFGRIESLRHTADGREETSTRSFALSRRFPPKRFAELVRAHWGIENHLHWNLDVVFHEDDARSRKNYAPESRSAERYAAQHGA